MLTLPFFPRALVVLTARSRILPVLLNAFLVFRPQKELLDNIKGRFIGISIEELNWESRDIDSLVFATKILWSNFFLFSQHAEFLTILTLIFFLTQRGSQVL